MDLGPPARRWNDRGSHPREWRRSRLWHGHRQELGLCRPAVVMTDERLLVGFLVLIAIGVSFVLTIFAFGLVVLVALLLASAGLVLRFGGDAHRSASGALMVAAVTALVGPVVYVGSAILQL